MVGLITKRLYDLFFSTSGLLVLGLPLLAIAAAVKGSDRGPVFYKQQRVGRHGRLFWIWKFRTMVVNAERFYLEGSKPSRPKLIPR